MRQEEIVEEDGLKRLVAYRCGKYSFHFPSSEKRPYVTWSINVAISVLARRQTLSIGFLNTIRASEQLEQPQNVYNDKATAQLQHVSPSETETKTKQHH